MAYHRTADHSDLSVFANRLWLLMERNGYTSAPELAKKLYDCGLVTVEQKDTYRSEKEKRDNAIDSVRKKILKHLNSDTPRELQGEFTIAYCKLFKCDADYLLGNINLPTREDTDINKKTGLNENAIQTLKILKRSDYIEFINFIMKDYAKFGRFLSSISLYFDNDYDTPVHYDTEKQIYVESEEPEDTIMLFGNEKTIVVGRKTGDEVLGYPAYETIHLPTTILESHAMHCIQLQLDEWKQDFNKERKRLNETT